jgi:hypothetical protein
VVPPPTELLLLLLLLLVVVVVVIWPVSLPGRLGEAPARVGGVPFLTACNSGVKWAGSLPRAAETAQYGSKKRVLCYVIPGT